MTSLNEKITEKNVFIGLITTGVMLRLGWMLLIHPDPISDTAVYFDRALSIASGDGYAYPDGTPTAYWPVGYPAFLAFCFWLGSESTVIAKTANIIFFTGTCLFLRSSAKTLGIASGATLCAAFLALTPNRFAYTVLFASEPLALFLLSATVYFSILCFRRHQGWLLVATGVTTALAVFAKPQFALAPMVVAFLISLNNKSYWRTARSLAMVYMIAIICIAPWTVRNYYTFDALVPISNNGGINLYIGNNEHATGRYNWDDEVRAPLSAFMDEELEYERDQLARSLAIDYIINHPYDFVTLVPKKLFYLFKTEGEGLAWNEEALPADHPLVGTPTFALKVLSQLIYLSVIALSAVGLVSLLTNRPTWSELIPATIAVYLTAVYVVFFGSTRFHHALIPFFFIYADAAIPYVQRLLSRVAVALPSSR